MAVHIIPRPSGEDKTVRVRQLLEDRLPKGSQWLLTAVTGQPRDGEQPLFEPPTPVLVGLELVALGGAIAVGVLPFVGTPWALPLLPYAFGTAVGRLRWLQTELTHYVIHGAPGESPWWATLGTVIPLAQNEDDYMTEHVGVHHPLKTFATSEDPDATVLAKFGIISGLGEAELMRRLRRNLVSPRFHAWFLKTRTLSNIWKPKKLYRRIVGVVWLGFIMGLLTVMPPAAWIVMVAGPYTIGYQMSALLQFATEHLWGGDVPPGTRRAVALSQGRFCGEAPPEGGITAWSTWTMRMLTIHLLTRLAILPGSLPSHDAHHVAEKLTVKTWRRATYVRSDLIAEGNDKGMAERESWGIVPALRAVFESMSRNQ